MAKKKALRSKARKQKQQTNSPEQFKAAKIDGDMSHAHDVCGNGKLADAYAQYTGANNDMPGRFKYFYELLSKDEIATKILNKPPTDALTNWRDSGYEWEQELNAPQHVLQAARFARTYGVCGILPLSLIHI